MSDTPAPQVDGADPAPPPPTSPDAPEVAALRSKLADLEKKLQEQAAALATTQATRELDAAGALDGEVVRLIAEGLMRQGAATFAEAVAEVKRRKPFLFRGAQSLLSALGAGSDQAAPAPAPPARGDRRSVLDFLRAKRA